MTDSEHMRPDVAPVSNEVYMVVIAPEPSDDPDAAPNTMNVKAVAAAYDLNKGPLDGARQLNNDETSNDFGDFVDEVREDMMDLTSNTVMAYAWDLVERISAAPEVDRKRTASELYLKLLLDFGDKPVELLGNMFATFLLACIEDVAAAEDYEQRMAEWEARTSDDQAGKE